MQHLGRKALFVVVLLAVFAWSIIPPEKRIRLGKDLRGGTTLVYQLQIQPGEDAGEVVQRTIEVLKDRVDPHGLYEISIVPQGRDRLEITMPLPSPEMQRLRGAYEQALEQFQARSLSPAELDRVLASEPERRQAEIQRLAGDDPERLRLLEQAAAARDDFERARANYEAEVERLGPDASYDQIEPLSEPVFEARQRFEEARGAVLGTSPSADEIREVLNRSPRSRALWNPQTRKQEPQPSPRQRGIEDLVERYPAAADEIREVVGLHDRYLAQRTTLDDPSDLIRLLRASGVLSFRISVDPSGENSHPREADLRQRLREEGPRAAGAPDARWYRINNIETWYGDANEGMALREDPVAYFADRGYVVEEHEGEYWMLLWDTPSTRLTQSGNAGTWSVESAFQTADEIGRPAIGFRMGTSGAALLGALTEKHVGNKMAVLLDDQVYTAPRLQSRISRQGQITGEFSRDEINYVVKVLSAGSLQAKLSPSPISQNTIGPELGADNLRAGMWAGIYALLIVSVFMVFYYFKAGLVAVIALACNALIILGALSLNRAALTLPGIAGIVLTFGMAVDANVLIYERIREELRAGQDLKAAVRLGYGKALSSIVDGNVTNLIVCIVLVLPGVSTQEVKGFAITLGIGVVATMFSALVISRLIFAYLLQHFGMRKLNMLPTIVPAIERALEPKINWIGLRWLFVIISTIYVGLGLGMIWHQGSEMLDTEFLGGIKVVLKFKEQEPGRPVTLDLEEVRRRVQSELVERAQADEDLDHRVLLEMRNAEVVPLDPGEGGTVSDTFQIKTTIENDQMVRDALVEVFADVLDVKPALRFRGMDPQDEPRFFPVTNRELRANLRGVSDSFRFETDDVRDYMDGVVVLLEGLDPPPTLADLRQKLEQFRQQNFPETLSRSRELFVLEGTPEAVRSAAVVVDDPEISFVDDRAAWERDLALQEWEMAREALARSTTLAQVDKFSASIARTFKGRALAAVVLSFLFISIYIWVRFGAMRYALAGIVGLLHDVLTVIGLIALAEIVYDWGPSASIARSLGIMPFKIDLNMVAAILTVIGYSLNDSIIIMDRIRENRGKLPYASRDVVNLSINQTISRTLITSGTTLMATLILFLFGGEGVRAFSFALFVGVLVGTYSSIAVGAPLVWSRRRDRTNGQADALAPQEPPPGPHAGV